MAVYSYSRVSTLRQSDDGDSLDTQQAKNAGYAMILGETIVEEYVERGVSGSVRFIERPEGSRLWAILKKGDAIICPKLDRMFRSALDALDTLSKMKERGVRLYLIDMGGDVTSNGIAKLVFTILSAVAEAERDRIKERITEVKTHQRSQGRYLGGRVPFGWAVGSGGDLLPVPEDQEAIGAMRRLRQDGLSLRAIADQMSGTGKKISFKAVSDILAREQGSNATTTASSRR